MVAREVPLLLPCSLCRIVMICVYFFCVRDGSRDLVRDESLLQWSSFPFAFAVVIIRAQTISLIEAEIWDALRAATEASDLAHAQLIVESAGIIVSAADMSTCYDERGTSDNNTNNINNDDTLHFLSFSFLQCFSEGGLSLNRCQI